MTKFEMCAGVDGAWVPGPVSGPLDWSGSRPAGTSKRGTGISKAHAEHPCGNAWAPHGPSECRQTHVLALQPPLSGKPDPSTLSLKRVRGNADGNRGLMLPVDVPPSALHGTCIQPGFAISASIMRANACRDLM